MRCADEERAGPCSGACAGAMTGLWSLLARAGREGASRAVTYAPVMDSTAVRLEAPATPTAPALRLRPWCPADAAGLVAVFRDDGPLRRWVADAPHDEAGALWWVRERRRLWESGDRFSFAVVEGGDRVADGLPSGHVVL